LHQYTGNTSQPRSMNMENGSKSRTWGVYSSCFVDK
jgi:hypothetical protein